jgi:hypothetical protein
MIPDIALMIVAYGSARLLTAALEPHRRGTGQYALLATCLSWVIVVFAIATLAFLGLAVVQSSASLPDPTNTR